MIILRQKNGVQDFPLPGIEPQSPCPQPVVIAMNLQQLLETPFSL